VIEGHGGERVLLAGPGLDVARPAIGASRSERQVGRDPDHRHTRKCRDPIGRILEESHCDLRVFASVAIEAHGEHALRLDAQIHRTKLGEAPEHEPRAHTPIPVIRYDYISI
jgi:hypothetical protein